MDPLLPISEAQERLAACCRRLPVVALPLTDAGGTTLGEDVVAREDSPPFNASTMDGYALRHEDLCLEDAAETRLPVYASTVAGQIAPALPRGYAARVMTGAPIAEGADAVVPIEWTHSDAKTVVVAGKPATAGQYIRKRGSDFVVGDPLLPCGSVLGPGQLALAASAGYDPIRVSQRPRVALVATGSELVATNAPLPPGAIRESNRHMLRGLCEGAGAVVTDLGIVGDDPHALGLVLAHALGKFDLVVTSGGVSVGDADYVKQVAEELGVKRLFWRVRVKPGKPVYAGTYVGDTRSLMLGLPGNPAAVLVTALLFVLPVLRRLQGDLKPLPPTLRANLANEVRPDRNRPNYLRALASVDASGKLWVRTGLRQSSGSQRSVSEANAVIVVAPGTSALEPGSLVDIHLLSRALQVEEPLL